MDDARYPRVWEISQRGARSPEATRGELRADHSFGRLRVRLIEREAASVIYDFVAHTADARVATQPGGAGVIGLQRKLVEVDQRLRLAAMTQPVAGQNRGDRISGGAARARAGDRDGASRHVDAQGGARHRPGASW